MTGEEFTAALGDDISRAITRLGQLSAAGAVPDDLDVSRLLLVALKNELEAAEIAALWMATTPELEVKLALARQAGDEARHYRLILDRLRELGVEVEEIDPSKDPYSPMFHHLRQLQGTAARVAAGQFAREGIALVRNQCFIEFCEMRGDARTAALYRDQIQPDEQHHHELGRRLLARFAGGAEEQRSARAAAERTLELAEEIQEMARLRAGICRAPGC